MTNTPDHLETIRLAKQEHAVRVITQLTIARDEMLAEPDLYFGGLPALYDDLARVIEHRIQAIRDQFQLPATQTPE
jgi:hypothetical protein